MDRLKRQLKRAFPEIIWNPIYLHEHALRTQIREAIEGFDIGVSDKWLDVGCGLRPYEGHFPKSCYVGIDVESSGRDRAMKVADCYYDGRVLPFPDHSFDGVLSTQVLEHVPNPRSLLAEMHRVTKEGGGLVLSLPFLWQEHEEPYDYSRFSTFGIAELLTQAGFDIHSMTKDTGAIEALAVTANVYIINNLVPPIRVLGWAIVICVCFPIQLLALALQRVLPDQGKLYLNLVIRASGTDATAP